MIADWKERTGWRRKEARGYDGTRTKRSLEITGKTKRSAENKKTPVCKNGFGADKGEWVATRDASRESWRGSA